MPQLEPSELPIELRPSRVRTVLLSLVSAALTIAGLGLIPASPIVAYIDIGLFGLCTVVFLSQLVTGLPRMRLDEDGFSISGLHGPRTVYWHQVAGFSTMRIGMLRRVVWMPAETPDAAAKTGNLKTLSKMKTLPDSFGVKPQLLADLMNALRLQASMTDADS